MNRIVLPIETDRLILRDFVVSDWNAVHSYASLAENVRYNTFGPNTVQESKNFISRALILKNTRPRLNYELAVILKSESRLIGGCGFSITDSGNRIAELGYILHRDYWGRGYATEAAMAATKLAFEKLLMHRVYARCFEENVASAHVLEKLGMQREGRFRKAYWRNVKWNDILIYGILDDEWKC